MKAYQRQLYSLLQLSQRGIKSSPNFNQETDANKINSFKGDLSAYFEDLLRRRPPSSGGYINLPKENFKLMVTRAATKADLATLVYAHANYLGHRNILPQSYLDKMLLKALELGHPETMLDVLKLHAELLCHPSSAILQKYLDHFKLKPYDQFKLFFDTVRGNYLLVKPSGFQTTAIELAAKENDKKGAILAYLDILDYSKADLKVEHLKTVYEALDYEQAVDHHLVDHLGKTAAKIGAKDDATLKAHSALYFYTIKGYLTVADLLKEIAFSKNEATQIGNSENLKKGLFAHIFAPTTVLDIDVKHAMVDAIKQIPLTRWADRSFYGMEEHLIEKVEEPIVVQAAPVAAEPVTEADPVIAEPEASVITEPVAAEPLIEAPVSAEPVIEVPVAAQEEKLQA